MTSGYRAGRTAPDSPSQWFSTRGSSPSPQGTTASSGDFGCHPVGRVTGRGQGCCQNKHSTGQPLPTENEPTMLAVLSLRHPAFSLLKAGGIKVNANKTRHALSKQNTQEE